MAPKRLSHKKKSGGGRRRDMTAILRTFAIQAEAEDDPKRQDSSLKAMKQFAAEIVSKGITGLLAEYTTFSKFEIKETCSVYEKNALKNRFKNVKCFDKTRVVLTYLPNEGDYIHANWVRSNLCDKMPNKFICTQGPTEVTVNDFWRMMWQEKPEHIVMLCKNVENNVPKCAEYYPPLNETKTYGTIIVRSTRIVTQPSEKAFESIQLNYSISTDVANNKIATVHKWKDWPDFGVPTSGLGMIRLLKLMREDVDATVVVHCSAGVGRTGTLVATAFAFQILFEGKELKMPELVKEMRTQRDGLIQKDSQYIFVHRALAEYIQNKTQDKTLFKSFFDKYKRYVAAQSLPITAAKSSPTLGA